MHYTFSRNLNPSAFQLLSISRVTFISTKNNKLKVFRKKRTFESLEIYSFHVSRATGIVEITSLKMKYDGK